MMGEIWMKNMGGREEKEWEMGERGGGKPAPEGLRI